MKMVVALLAGATLLAANTAMASKARPQALGQDENGSYYIQDTRNMFLNPATLATSGNFAQFELGAGNPEGGFAMQAGGLTYGLHLGHQASPGFSAALAELNDAGGANMGLPTPENTLELFVAGQAGVNWGASFYYSAVDGIQGNEDAALNQMGVRAGASTDMWSATLNLGLGATSQTADDTGFTGNMSYRVGGSYNLGTGVIYADITGGGFEVEAAGNPAAETTASSYELGWANRQEIQEGAFFFYSVAYAMEASEETVGETEASASSLPVTIGFEANANSWLALRGSVKQTVLVNTAGDGDATWSAGNNTNVGAGASLMFDQLRVDGTVFTGGTLDTNSLLGNVAVVYNF